MRLIWLEYSTQSDPDPFLVQAVHAVGGLSTQLLPSLGSFFYYPLAQVLHFIDFALNGNMQCELHFSSIMSFHAKY